MSLQLRHILLLVGIAAVILSFLFFGRATTTYDVMLLAGLCLSAIAYLVILFKDRGRNRIAWTLVVFAGIGLQNEPHLSRVNDILFTKGPHTIWVHDPALWRRHAITAEEGMNIENLVKNMHISFIEKDSVKIYYRTFGMLNVSHGLFYFYTGVKPENRFKYLSGNWYF